MPGIEELARIRAMLSQAKVAAVTQWLGDREQELEPVVLFSQHVSILKKIADNRPGWQSFHGGLTAKKRQALVDKFQAGEIEYGLAVSIGAGGEGITLTRARVAGFIDLNWNPAKNNQAESRLIRIGAEKHDSIVIVRFVANHVVDQLVIRTLVEKELVLRATFDWDDEEVD
jgi:SNF2 family DNA or RNA helicase